MGRLAWPAAALAVSAFFPSAAPADVPPGPPTPEDASPLPVLGPAPEFHLRSLEGPGVRTRDLRGKLLLLAFACASCPEEPEEAAATFVQVQRALKARGLFGKKVVLAFLVRHPDRESRASVRAYASRLGVDPYGWVILSGSPQTTAKLREEFGRFGVEAGQAPADTRGHVFLVDYAGRVRRIYSAGILQADTILADLERLF